jgi:hypothetical protein
MALFGNLDAVMKTLVQGFDTGHISLALVALFLALLFSVFVLAACKSDEIITTHAASISENKPEADKGEGYKPTPDRRTSFPSVQKDALDFDCSIVKQISSIECAALVALYNRTNGPDWIDNSGWLATVTPCNWSGIERTGGHVSYISLGYNQLTGILPPELGNLSHLHALGLSSNRLHGPIPAEMGNLSELVSLEMSGNQLAGPLPAELGDLPNLRTLSLGNNKLSGSIPPALGNFGSLQSLVLSNNQFSGAIPVELGNLVQLYSLYLSHNELSGTIPVELSSLSQLSELDLSYNQLSGPVPEFIAQINRRSLWGNQLDGTITANGHVSFTVDYMGVHFSADPSLANSIWPEMIPATPALEALEGPSFWSATPKHIRFTFTDPCLSPGRRRMGFNLAAEAQILVFPLTELVDINPLVETQIETLRNVLADRGTVPSGELPLLPLTNAAQVFHAKAQHLVSGNVQGLRFISQHSQNPRPIMLSQELFYTFQGFTKDGAYYVAAFFPVTTAVLPDTIEVDDWEAFHANYDTYLSETTAVLDQLPPAGFTPDLTLLDAAVTSLWLEPNAVLFDEPLPH